MLPKLKDLVLVQTKEWYDLGLQLGVEDTDLDVIQSNNPQNLRACRREMFKAWLKMTPTPTYQQLVDALMAVGEVREADTLRKKYGKCTAAAFLCCLQTSNLSGLFFPCRTLNLEGLSKKVYNINIFVCFLCYSDLTFFLNHFNISFWMRFSYTGLWNSLWSLLLLQNILLLHMIWLYLKTVFPRGIIIIIFMWAITKLKLKPWHCIRYLSAYQKN